MIVTINHGKTGLTLQITLRDLSGAGTTIESKALTESGNPGEYVCDLTSDIGSYHVTVEEVTTSTAELTGYITLETNRYRLFRSRDEIETETSNRPIAFNAQP